MGVKEKLTHQQFPLLQLMIQKSALSKIMMSRIFLKKKITMRKIIQNLNV